MLNTITNPVIEELLLKLRDPKTGRKDFRETIEKIGQVMGIKVSEMLQTKQTKIETVLKKEATHKILAEQPVLITILRGGMPLLNGLTRVFTQSESGYIGAMRDQKTLEAEVSYVALPDIEGKTIIVADTMLATSGSLIQTLQVLKKRKPKKIILVCVIASYPGIQRLQKYDKEININCAVIDPELNQNGYIVPGLGDAGDRCFGRKI